MTSPSTFAEDLKDLHLIYDYDAQDPDGKPEKWRYEMWFFSEVRDNHHISTLQSKA
jgi:hypothetical protein